MRHVACVKNRLINTFSVIKHADVKRGKVRLNGGDSINVNKWTHVLWHHLMNRTVSPAIIFKRTPAINSMQGFSIQLKQKPFNTDIT